MRLIKLTSLYLSGATNDIWVNPDMVTAVRASDEASILGPGHRHALIYVPDACFQVSETPETVIEKLGNYIDDSRSH